MDCWRSASSPWAQPPGSVIRSGPPSPLLVLGIATTVVRGALFGLAVGLAYLGGHRHRVLLLLFPLGLVSLLILPPDVTAAALSTSSGQERTTGWQENMKVITSHP